ncbi:MAG: thiamine phosphate synthase [Candidatus Eremiobacteraeota bacterium]|nr:thiamine phosphate synthase [Candidatus Eremiobacteraeota bacterium]
MAAHEAPALARVRRAQLLRGIYLIVNEGAESTLPLAIEALRAGVRIVQYRAKAGIHPQRLRALRTATASAGALLIVNDDCEAVGTYDCDGVHLGPGDRGFDDIAAVRRALGDRLIGLSCGTLAEIETAYAAGADYAGVGSVYATSSKADAGDPIGVDGLMRIASATPLPVAAIGGIDAARIADVRAAGASMAAVISAVSQSGDYFAAATALVRAWERAA